MSEEKTMQDEANEEWAELALENLDKLIPKDWGPTLHEVILPKLLFFIKKGLKQSIKTSADFLGKDKYAVMCNLPIEYKPGEIIWVPHYVKIDKAQLKNEFALKDGEDPESIVSYLDVYKKIDGYTNVKDMITDIKSGNFLKGIVSGTSHGTPDQKELEQQKQLDAPTEPKNNE